MNKYDKADVEAIQKGYRRLFPVINKEIEQFWYPTDNYDWLCLVSRFNELGPTFGDFQGLHDDLTRFERTSEHNADGATLAQLARKRGVGYSIGLNPWADYLLSEARDFAPQEVVVIIGYNWYPLITKDGKLPNSPLNPENPLTSNSRKYSFIFEPFFEPSRTHLPDLLVFFTNIFPHFLEAGVGANAGLNRLQKALVHSGQGMKKGLIDTLEAINPSIHIRGLVFLGGSVLSLFSRERISKVVKNLQTSLPTSSRGFSTISVGSKEIPYLPFFHPAARELIPHADRKTYQELYKKLANALVQV